MTVFAFISATKEDLGLDCRPAVIEAVQMCEAVPVTMEVWNTDYRNVVLLCCEMLEGKSTHFIGIFAYYYGCIPPDSEKSITEIEFDWAMQLKKPMAIFIPNPVSKLASELRQRAIDQKTCDWKAQDAFRSRIKNLGTCMLFNDVNDLSCRVTRRVTLWEMEGILNETSKIKSINYSHNQSKIARTTEDQILQLGRRFHVRQFIDSLELGQNKFICFFVHGVSGSGHKEMLTRLRKEFEQNARSQPKRCIISLDIPWRKKNLYGLLQTLENQLGNDWVIKTAEDLATNLHKILKSNDLILEITGIQCFDGSIPRFYDEFWHPIASELKRHQLTNYFLVLLSFEGAQVPIWDEYMQPPLSYENGFFKIESDLIVKLPKLHSFTEDELAVWFFRFKNLHRDKAKAISKIFIKKTGGYPDLLYNRLRDDFVMYCEE